MALPRLFVKEAFMVSRQAFVENKEGIPLTPYASPMLQGLSIRGRRRCPRYMGMWVRRSSRGRRWRCMGSGRMIRCWRTG